MDIVHHKNGFRYVDSGSGPAVLFLHGLAENVSIWAEFVEHFSLEYRVIAVDLYGHTPKNQYHFDASKQLQDYAVEVLDLLKEIGVEEVAVVGHSMGGYVALEMLKLQPTYLTGISLFHSQPFADTEEIRSNRMRIIQDLLNGKKSDVIEALFQKVLPVHHQAKHPICASKLYAMMNQVDPKGLATTISAIAQREDSTSALIQSTIPVQFILGGIDSFIPVQRMLELIPEITNCSVTFLKDVGHVGMLEEANQCIAALNSFFTLAYPEVVDKCTDVFAFPSF
jgi:pimeloyl-ACP methyl ester carboxylesterase